MSSPLAHPATRPGILTLYRDLYCRAYGKQFGFPDAVLARIVDDVGVLPSPEETDALVMADMFCLDCGDEHTHTSVFRSLGPVPTLASLRVH